MAQWPNPTASGLVAEAMRTALGRAATSGEVARGLDVWIPEIHGDIWMGAPTHRLLETSTLVLLTEGRQLYDFPSDADSLISLTLMDGAARNTMQSATASTATLAAADSASSAARIGREIVTLSGTGAGQRRTIYGWTAPTITSMNENWTTTPDSTTTYVIVDDYKSLAKMVEDRWLREPDRTERDKPRTWVQEGRQYRIRPVPDKTYPLIVRYWIDLQKLDLASTAFTDCLRTWRSLYTQGIFVKTLRDEDDSRKDTEFAIYQGMIARLTGKGAQSGFLTPDS